MLCRPYNEDRPFAPRPTSHSNYLTACPKFVLLWWLSYVLALLYLTPVTDTRKASACLVLASA
jgi:hypothetical protein